MIAVSHVLFASSFKMDKLHCLLVNLEVWKCTKLLKDGIFQKEMSSLTAETLSNTYL